jgi:hypothetical protein
MSDAPVVLNHDPAKDDLPEDDFEGEKAPPSKATPEELAKYHVRWEREFAAADKEFEKVHDVGKKVIHAYLDKRQDSVGEQGAFRLNLFWSNCQVIKSNLYSKPPKVDVSRLYNDPNDDIARVAATILERILNSGLESDNSDFDTAAFHGIDDYLLPGIGQMWMDYKPYFEPFEIPAVTDPMTGQVTQEAQQSERIADEDATSEYIYWEDFKYSPARTWEEVRWVAKRVFLSKQKAAARFGADLIKLLPTTKVKKARQINDLGPQDTPWTRIEIWEIWSKLEKKVYWYVPGFDRVLDCKDDPLGLENFFPCPKPLVANVTTSNFKPLPDYLLAQDQYNQIDELTTRITYLTRACKMVGVYDKNSTPVGRIFMEGMENQMIPVDNWQAFAEKGGLKGQMDFVPIEIAAAVIEKLTVQRDILIGKLYEVMGIADIMRGNSNPSETLGAQKIKAQFGSARLEYKQSEIDKWATCAQQIKANIICDHWQPDTIKRRSNIMNSVDAPLADQAIALLKTEGISSYRIRIEPESMAAVDWAKKQEERSNAINGMGVFMQSMTALIQAEQKTLPFVLEIMKWFMAGFGKGKEIETIMDQAIQAAQGPKEDPKPTPKEQAEIAKAGAETQQKRAGAVNDLADSMSKGFIEPVNAMLNEMGLPPADPLVVAAATSPPPKEGEPDGDEAPKPPNGAAPPEMPPGPPMAPPGLPPGPPPMQ